MGSFDEIYEKHRDFIYNFAYKLSKNEHDAKDVTQEAFIKILASLDKISSMDDDQQRCYIGTITLNAFIDFSRKKKIELLMPEDLAAILSPREDEHVFEGLYASDRKKLVESLLKTLEKEDPLAASITMSKYFDNMKDKETGKLFGISHANVRTKLTRSRQRLIEIYESMRNGDENPYDYL